MMLTMGSIVPGGLGLNLVGPFGGSESPLSRLHFPSLLWGATRAWEKLVGL